jgi:polyphenol oxidase
MTSLDRRPVSDPGDLCGTDPGSAPRRVGPADAGSHRTVGPDSPGGGTSSPGVRVLEVELGPGIRAGFTRRDGGVSVGPWAGLNLGLHVGDDPGEVRHNRRLLRDWAGAPVRFPRQIHGTDVLVVEALAQELSAGGDPAEPARDAIVTAAAGVPVGVLVADCVPILLADPVAGVVGAVHAGRRGLLAGVVENTVAAMCALGAAAERINAAIGPCAGACCYEVPAQLRAESARRLPQTWADTRWGTPSLDLPGGCRAALERVGVTRWSAVGRCTIEDTSFYSYRREPVTGRFAGVVMMSE